MNKRIFIAHLPANITNKDLEKLFSGFGRLVDLYIPMDRETRRAKGFAFVELQTEQDAQKAIAALNNKTIGNNRLSLSLAQDKEDKGSNSQSRGKVTMGRNNNKRGGMRSAGLSYDKYIKKAQNIEEEIYVAKHTFNDFDLDMILKANIQDRGYEIPTPIQDNAIDYIMEGKDVIGIANTGTGKTAAFLIPLINKVLNDRKQKVLIIVPTRELATQINDEFKLFAKGTGIHSAICIGGTNIKPQVFSLKKNPRFIIGTPGRLKDLVDSGYLYMDKINNLVLDEVDRMFDMGFIDDIKYLTEMLTKDKQSLFFSATLSREIETLINKVLINPVKVSVKLADTAANVDQDIVKILKGQDKTEILHELLIKEGFEKVLIFGRTKRSVDKLEKELFKRGFKVQSIHGDKAQGKRQRALAQFKENKVNILVATDVAARGLDIDGVTHVINFEEPQSYEDYIHRIGRTGRANKKGIALTFVS